MVFDIQTAYSSFMSVQGDLASMRMLQLWPARRWTFSWWMILSTKVSTGPIADSNQHCMISRHLRTRIDSARWSIISIRFPYHLRTVQSQPVVECKAASNRLRVLWSTVCSATSATLPKGPNSHKAVRDHIARSDSTQSAKCTAIESGAVLHWSDQLSWVELSRIGRCGHSKTSTQLNSTQLDKKSPVFCQSYSERVLRILRL